MNKQDRAALWPIVRGMRELAHRIEQGTYNKRLIMANDATMSEYATILADAIVKVMTGKP